MDKEQIELRIKNIQDEMQQVRAHYAKLEGHLVEAQYWLTFKPQKVCELHVGEYDGKINNETEECIASE